MKRKPLLIFTVLAVLLTVCCVSVHAETEIFPPVEPPQTSDSGEDILEDPLQEFIKASKENGTVYDVKFTSDSVCTEGVYIDMLYDELEKRLYLLLTIDLPSGYSIYDNPDTEYVEGLKINDAYASLGSKPFKIYLDNPLTSYTVFVKTTYADTMYGTIAKIQDGNATVLDLFDSPMMLMQTLYYCLAAVSVIIAAALAFKSKKIKAKTSEQIATETASALLSSNEDFKNNLVSEVMSLISNQLIPALNTCVNANQNVVKAIAISNSKDRNAPVALLDVLREVADTAIEAVVDEAIASAEKHIEDSEAAKTETLNALHEIATSEPSTENTNVSIF